jgi:tetratricopeptide (TPR) repeat protein
VSNTSIRMRTSVSFPLVIVLAAAVGLAGCAPKARLDPSPGFAVTRELASADALVARGCYTCLQEALAIYERVAAAGTAAAADRLAIDAALLLALRERELGLGGGKSREHAIDLASRQPAPFDVGVFRSVVEIQAWNASGVSQERVDESMAPLRTLSSAWKDWRGRLLPNASSDLLSAYSLLALDCAARSFLADAGIDAWTPPPGVPPILAFRAAVCPLSFDETALAGLLTRDPRFAEAHLFLGQMSLGRGTLRTAEKHLQEAIAAIPELTAARLMLGHVDLAMEDFVASRDAFHEVNAAVPGLRDAMLGEVKSLSHLGLHEEAVTILNEMERLGTWYMGETYYWRAWNRHRLRQYDAANDDVLASRSRLPMDGQVDKLAGFIALARNEIPRAESEFRASVAHIEGMRSSDCESIYFLGSAQIMQRKWAEAAPNFEKAEPCYARARNTLKQAIDTIAASDLPDGRQARLIAAREKDIAAARLQEARSSYNAAVAYANLGDVAKARPCAERAAAHPDLAGLAKALLDRIGKPEPAPGSWPVRPTASQTGRVSGSGVELGSQRAKEPAWSIPSLPAADRAFPRSSSPTRCSPGSWRRTTSGSGNAPASSRDVSSSPARQR